MLEDFYQRAYSWIVITGPKVLVAVLALILGIWAIRILKKIFRKAVDRKSLNPSIRSFIMSLFTYTLVTILVLMILQILGIRMTIFATILGAMGVAAGLALSGTLQNFTSGILILFLKPFRVGDTILAQGHTGVVSSIQLFYTVVTTPDNKAVVFPNSKLSNEVIVNMSRQGKRGLDVEMKFNYGFDFEQVRSIILKSLKDSGKVLAEQEPVIAISTLEPDGYKAKINAWVDAYSFDETKYEIQKMIIEDIKKAGLKLPGMQ